MHEVGAYSFGSVEIDGVVYRKDVIVLPDRVVSPWWRRRGHRLLPEDLEEVLAADPIVLVVGTGYFGRMRIDARVQHECRQRGIELLVDPTGKAIDRYTDLGRHDHAVLAMHLTC